MTVTNELKAIAKNLRPKLAALGLDTLRRTLSDLDRRYEAAWSTTNATVHGADPKVIDLGRQITATRSALSEAEHRERRLKQQLAQVERLLNSGAREAAAASAVQQAHDAIQALTASRTAAVAMRTSLEEKLKAQREVDADATATLAVSIIGDLDQAVEMFGEVITTAGVSERATLIASAIVNADSRLDDGDRAQAAATARLKSAERTHAIAQLDCLELEHACALAEYLVSLGAFRAQHQEVFGFSADRFDYEALAEVDAGDHPVLRIVGL